MELSTRKVEIAGIAASANKLWMSKIGRNLTDAVEGILRGKRYLIHDRDPLFTTEFLTMLGVLSVSLHEIPDPLLVRSFFRLSAGRKDDDQGDAGQHRSCTKTV
jgi:hypothetical protein